MIRKPVLVVLAISILLAACQTDDSTQGNSFSSLNVLNSNPTNHMNKSPTITLTGSFLNSLDSHTLSMIDNIDRTEAAKAEQRAYTTPISQQVTWNNTNNGTAGTITPIRDGYAANGAYCREFQQTLNIGGRQQQAYGKACQQPDGSWNVVQ